MSDGRLETGTVFHELLDELRALEPKLYEGPNAPQDEQSVLEGYKWIFSILQVAFDVYVWSDTARPRFVDIVGPYKKWGGDNADAYYQFAPIDPQRTYRIKGKTGDAVYWSLTVYGGPDDGRYSAHLVGTVNDRMVEVAPDGTFEIVLSANPPEGGASLRLEEDSIVAITRDYLIDPVHGRRVEWHIEADDPPASYRLTDADLARRLRAVITWIKEQSQMVPLPLGEPNVIDPPYPVPTVTYGWAAGDAAYAMGSFELAEDQALVVKGRSPECAFWNLCLWNPFLHTYNYEYERVTINGGQVQYEDDGSWTVMIAHRDPGHPNWVSTQGHPRGRIWLRWFLPDATPEALTTEVVKISA